LQPGSAELQRPGKLPGQPAGHSLLKQLAPFVPPVHVMSHAQASEQSIRWQLCRPVHATLHLPLPQSRSRHD